MDINMASTVTKPNNGPLGNNNSKGTSGEKSSKGSEIQSKGATNLGNGSFSSGFKEAQLGNNSEQEIKKQQQLETINKFWFLLDHELVAAVNKGNHALLPMAEAKVDFLLGVVSRELLEEGVKGDEEALWSIHEFLYNNGWWEKASNLEIERNDKEGDSATMDPLLLFLSAYEHLIHPNTRIEALQGQREAVRMALNQIHYGSIELARQEQKGISMTKGERADNKGANVSELQAQAGVMAKRGKQGSRVRPVNLQQSQPHSQDSALYINGFRQLSQGQYSEANNDTTLLNFIRANADLVHPNTIAKASNGDQEGVRMALHQIHFGSLSARPIQKKPKFISPNKKDYMVEEQKIITYDFLKVHASMVEPGVLKDALGGNDKALSLALGQIHHHTLTGDHASTKPLPQSPSQTFREALLKNSARPSPTVKRSPPPKSQSSRKKGDMAPKSSIFFTELDDSLHMKDLWSLFKKEGKIRDIILPRKRDKFGNRFGFLLVSDEKQADNIISALNGKLIGSRKLYLAKAKGAQKPPSQPPKSASSTRAPKVHITPPESPKSVSHSLPRDLPSPPASVELLPDEDFIHIMENSLFLRTVKHETTDTVGMIAEGLGAVNALIRGLSGDRFIAYFPHYMDLQDTDREFLKIGFAEVRDLHLDDLLPSRKTWVEVRGLPIVGWNEDNFKNILSSFGTILQFGKTRDEEDFYQTPKFLLETQSVSEINEIKYINLMGKIWKVRFLETTGDLSQLNDAIPNDFSSYSRDSPANDFIQSRRSCESTKKSEGECMSISSNPAGSTALPEHNHFNDHELVDDEEEVQEILAEDEEEILDEEVILEENRTGNVVLIDSEIETHTLTDEGCGDITIPEEENLAGEVSNSDINPLTPFSEESPITLVTTNWLPRDRDTSPSDPLNASDSNGSVVDEESLDEFISIQDRSMDILQDLDKLKVKGRRGRPRKLNSNKINKSFKLPKRRRKKGEGLQQISHFFLNNSTDEAESILETGLLMGLLPNNSRQESLELIRQNLAA
ncbi:hypothetical protein DCAR_0831856 [Daucus carota subsp. sativus]|uniref:RRM domain-containing protein n=1 Tax=Daucus carota subsp. sativus TaxID=79200 RepID=A0AAF0XT54_DAUCS|nr:hypothetical protein DCAR_0831856 [Daucus carota subsp. sativus]